MDTLCNTLSRRGKADKLGNKAGLCARLAIIFHKFNILQAHLAKMR